ncbi:DNA translocase FtsK [Entomobacter blattae]|uniref:DNA translocase FtsK n=1 Tax=Entomobacter blattae TaxID=2762277 RepID=A0A7H1NPM3_9PROT|nr:DNA translocase FtsK [Entomobacter blattae]QNT77733.1 FtsK/SpoIIIE family protein [Entomobacter blattae]
MAFFSRFIPDNLVSPTIKQFIKNRIQELTGIILWMISLGLGVALWSYNPKDASLNTSTNTPVTNIAGVVGADIADLLIQWIGLGCAFLLLCLMIWGWRLMRYKGIGSLFMRLLGGISSIVLLTTLISTLAQLFPIFPKDWPSSAGVGGFIGSITAQRFLTLAHAILPNAEGILVLGIGSLLSCLFIPMAFGLSLREWQNIFYTTFTGFGYYRRNKKKTYRSAVRPSHFRYRQNPEQAAYPFQDTETTDHFAVPEHSPPYSDSPSSTNLPALYETHEETHNQTWDPPSLQSAHSKEPSPPSVRRRPPPPLPVSHPAEEEIPVSHASSFTTNHSSETIQRAASAFSLPENAAEKEGSLSKLGKFFSRSSRAQNSSSSSPGGKLFANSDSATIWTSPPITLLHQISASAQAGPSEETLQANARLLETVLADYGVQGTIGEIHAGPVVTLYELEPAPGIRSARVIGLSSDIARSLSVISVRIATVPGRNVIGIEVPNALRETVYLSELLLSERWENNPTLLSIALGKNIFGEPVYANLAKMPHLLIAGTTGSGKSVGVNAMILSLLYRLSPDECRLILIDPKMLELSVYNGIPHLLTPVVTEPSKAVTALKWVVREMERRYRAMSQLGVRNVHGYNERVTKARNRGEVVSRKVQTGFDPETGKPLFEEQQLALESLPFIVVVIDEMADLMMVAGKEIEAAVQRLAQMARAAGIHVIMATQRPSVDVITGTIKANFPTRISFQVISKFDSRTILGDQGAEQLLGQGDMLYMQGGGRIMRVHGPFVSDDEVEKVVTYLRSQGEPIYLDEVTESEEEEGKASSKGNNNFEGDNNLYDQAIALVARERKASTSFIQRHLSIGYNRAAKLIEQMEKDRIVGPANHVGKREILIDQHYD